MRVFASLVVTVSGEFFDSQKSFLNGPKLSLPFNLPASLIFFQPAR